MIARVLWYSEERTCGVAAIQNEHGEVQHFYLLASKIVQRPERILPGYYVKFQHAVPPQRAGLLPVPHAAMISAEPLVDVPPDAPVVGAQPASVPSTAPSVNGVRP